MKPQLIKSVFLVAAILLVTTACYAQKEFFRSQHQFTNEQLNKFYSSISITGNLVLFAANDYHLYAYNKKDRALLWSYKMGNKNNIPVFVYGSIAYPAIYTNELEQTAQVNIANGKLIKVLPFGTLATKPMVKNGILYGTAIYNFGCLLAYDLKKDTVLWSRFLAHGYSHQPYYLPNKIMANAEGDNWAELNYKGVLLDTNCVEKKNIYVSDIPCVKYFVALSHDGLPIKDKLANTIFGEEYSGSPDMMYTKKTTCILNEGNLYIIFDNLKMKQPVQVSELAEKLADTDDNAKLLKADEENIWLIYSNHLLQYNYKTKQTIKDTNLTQWQPHRAVMDEENIWLISGKDGLLYGLSL